MNGPNDKLYNSSSDIQRQGQAAQQGQATSHPQLNHALTPPGTYIFHLQPIDFGKQAEKFKKCNCEIVSLMQQGCKCGGE